MPLPPPKNQTTPQNRSSTHKILGTREQSKPWCKGEISKSESNQNSLSSSTLHDIFSKNNVKHRIDQENYGSILQLTPINHSRSLKAIWV